MPTGPGALSDYRASSPSDRKATRDRREIRQRCVATLRNLGVSSVWRDKTSRTGTGIFNTDQPHRQHGRHHAAVVSTFLTVLSDLGTTSVLAFLDSRRTARAPSACWLN
ncbi:MAG: hypothetical protein IPP90_16325 [Gemmatimonadaceae bacterium]|nr:hypothetical protein [Gemmatimonadaceae bacterium]